MSKSETDRLRELLDLKDGVCDKLQVENERLRRELDGALGGWRNNDQPIDDGEDLPVPRLELVWVQDVPGEWGCYRVVYRMVTRHFLGHYEPLIISETRVRGGPCDTSPTHDPFRDGCHFAHDAAHWRMPAFRVWPGKRPEQVHYVGDAYVSARREGREHRRGE